MRFHFPTLFLVLFVFIGSATCSYHTNNGISRRPVPLRKRGEEGLANQLLKTQVPDRLKNWGIFKDGNFIREGVRKGYIGALRIYDRQREPYPVATHVKKEWVYEPDLRKHYVVPRVLRVPIVLQDKAIPHEKEFISHIKGTDKGLGLSDAAKKHVPDLMEEEETESSKSASRSAVKSEPEELQSDHNGRSTAFGRRRRARPVSNKDSFSHFRPIPNGKTRPPATSTSKIRSDTTLPDQPSTVVPPARAGASADDGSQRQSTAAPTGSEQSPAAIKLSNALLQMEENYKATKRLEDEQTLKTAMRYVGHPGYKPPPAPSGATSATAEPGAGLAPIRIEKKPAHEVTPNETPRQFVDLAGTDADRSNPITPPSYRPFYGPSGSSRDFSRQTSVEYSNIATPADEPSPRLSTGGLTPNSQVSTAASSPGASFRLPADHDDTVHSARFRSGLAHLRSSIANPSMSRTTTGEPVWNYAPKLGWDDGQPTVEGLRKMHQLAAVGERDKHIDVAIYDHDLTHALEKPYPWTLDKIRPVSDGEQSTGSVSPSTKRKDWRMPKLESTAPSGRQDTDLLGRAPAQQDRSGYIAGASSSPQPQRQDVEMKDAFSLDNNPASQSLGLQRADVGTQIDAGSPPREPAAKRKRPAPLKGALNRASSFIFQTFHTEPTSPYLQNFKTNGEGNRLPTDHSSPSVGQGFKQLMVSPRDRLREFQQMYKHKPIVTVYGENAANHMDSQASEQRPN